VVNDRKLKISSKKGLDSLVSPLRLSIKSLHQVFVSALDSRIVTCSDIEEKPLVLDLKVPLPTRIRVYMYNLTHPPGGRSLTECKIQLIVPGQTRGSRGHFDNTDGRFVILCGYDHRMEVFVLWDAEVYQDFSYSRNLQVQFEAVCAALSGNIGEQREELVITAMSHKLPEAIDMRWRLSIERIVGKK
jgi:hypothetical protein